ncbi:MAG: SDR family NAD(P)-dependent oxidoreductase [Acidimicrobiales bacterium]
MDLGLSGANVVVSGGASNIGRAISIGFAKEGANVVIADIDEVQAKRVAADASGGTILTRTTDVTDPESVEATVAFAIASLGSIDVLVNCAGWTIDRLFLDKPREEFEKEIAVDMWGFINFTRPVLAHMVERRRGRVVSIASDAGRIGEWREAVYSGTKASVIAMTKSLAKEVGKMGITLNVVCPGFTPGDPDTSGAESIWRGEQGEQFTQELLEKVARSYPLRRLGRPDDVVGPVLLFASDHASYITGQTLSVSGGYTMI